MRILCYNLHQGLDRGGRPVLDRMGDAIAAREPDFVTLQEVLDGFEPELAEQARRLGDRLGMHAHFGVNAVVRRGRLGNATLSAREGTGVAHTDLSIDGFEARGVLRLDFADGPSIWNVHLGLTRSQRLRQWDVLAGLLAGGGSRIALCGDFNDWSGDLDRAVKRHGRFANALAGLPRRGRCTFPARWPVFSLDRVYHHGLEVRGGRVLRRRPWTQLSDHLPVEVDFDEVPR